jgi:hypothetical protein
VLRLVLLVGFGLESGLDLGLGRHSSVSYLEGKGLNLENMIIWLGLKLGLRNILQLLHNRLGLGLG